MGKQLPQKIKTLTSAVLFLIGTGAITMAAICAPNALQLLRPMLRNSKQQRYYERKRIKEALERLARRHLVELHQRGNQLGVEITENGKKRLQKFDFENLRLPMQQKWDKKWRLVIFDIPEKHKRSRHTLQNKLKEIGFYPLQRSVFVYPFCCRDEVDFITSFCEVKPFVHYLETLDLDQKEGAVRRFFCLL